MSETKIGNELQLRTGPYRTTFVGTEIIRQSTKDEWRNYGEILKRVDEAKQWAIGDWLCDGKRHYGDGLYQEAEGVLGIGQSHLRTLKSNADIFELCLRKHNLTWSHHYEVASLKQIKADKKGKLYLSDEPDKEKMQEFLKKAEKNKWSVRELREAVKRYQRQQDEEIRLANMPEKYSVFYADPPWEYGDKLIEGYGAAEHHYPAMSIHELCELPIKNIVADNAVLFLWVTAPIVEECFEVIGAWGFEYKAQFIWDKVKHNYGHYNSVRHELLLICTRGSYLPETNELVDSIMSIERSDTHSEKPEEFRQIIERLYPTGKKIELFARKKVKHWEAWGDERNEIA